MRCVAFLTAHALLSIMSTNVTAQDTGDSGGSGKAQAKNVFAVSDFDEAIEIIATSTDRDAVNAAGAKLRRDRLAQCGARYRIKLATGPAVQYNS